MSYDTNSTLGDIKSLEGSMAPVSSPSIKGSDSRRLFPGVSWENSETRKAYQADAIEDEKYSKQYSRHLVAAYKDAVSYVLQARNRTSANSLLKTLTLDIEEALAEKAISDEQVEEIRAKTRNAKAWLPILFPQPNDRPFLSLPKMDEDDLPPPQFTINEEDFEPVSQEMDYSV